MTFDPGRTRTLGVVTQRHTISDAAARTGFSPSALRFYEDAGLIAPGRSDAGYRVYDDRAIERLRFISRLKQLGLTLEEIAELVGLWDRDPCSTVAARLAGLVDDKIRLAQDRIAEMVSLTSDLQRARAAMTTAGEEPCGDACACYGDDPAVTAVGVSLRPAPHPPGPTPIVCTLPADEVQGRVGEWQEVLHRVTARRTVAGGIELSFPADTALAADVARLAAAEQRCCTFFTFTLCLDRKGTTMTVTGPAEAAGLITAGFGAAT